MLPSIFWNIEHKIIEKVSDYLCYIGKKNLHSNRCKLKIVNDIQNCIPIKYEK